MKPTNEELWDYAEGNLAPQRASEIEKALAADPELSQEYELMVAVDKSLDRIFQEAKPPRDFAQKVMMAYKEKMLSQQLSQSQFDWKNLLPAVITLLFLIPAVLLVLSLGLPTFGQQWFNITKLPLAVFGLYGVLTVTVGLIYYRAWQRSRNRQHRLLLELIQEL